MVFKSVLSRPTQRFKGSKETVAQNVTYLKILLGAYKHQILTPLFVEKSRVAPDGTLRFNAHKQERVHAREPH